MIFQEGILYLTVFGILQKKKTKYGSDHLLTRKYQIKKNKRKANAYESNLNIKDFKIKFTVVTKIITNNF